MTCWRWVITKHEKYSYSITFIFKANLAETLTYYCPLKHMILNYSTVPFLYPFFSFSSKKIFPTKNIWQIVGKENKFAWALYHLSMVCFYRKSDFLIWQKTHQSCPLQQRRKLEVEGHILVAGTHEQLGSRMLYNFRGTTGEFHGKEGKRKKLIQGSDAVKNCIGAKIPWWAESERPSKGKWEVGKGGNKRKKQGQKREKRWEWWTDRRSPGGLARERLQKSKLVVTRSNGGTVVAQK